MKCLRHSSTFGAALFAVLMASTLSARETDSAPLALDGATPWNVDYADDSCALMRGFGEEDQRVFLELRQYSPGNALRLVVASSQFSFTRSNPIVTIAPGEPEELEEVQRIDADEMHGFTASFSLLDQIRDPDIDQDIFENDRAERESEIYGIQIADAIDQPIFLNTGAMRAPMEALRTCVDDLVTSWGVDVASLRTNSKAPTPLHQAEWVREVINHYPRNALRSRREATVRTTLLIDAEGRVARCAVRNALTQEDFVQVACAAFMAYGRFEPALDAEGEPTYGFWSTNVVYQLN